MPCVRCQEKEAQHYNAYCDDCWEEMVRKCRKHDCSYLGPALLVGVAIGTAIAFLIQSIW